MIMINGDFPPTSGPVGAMGYLELIFLRFQGLIWHIWGFCIFLGSGDIRKNVKVLIFGNFLFCKKKQKEINQDIVIKMFKKLKGKVHMANENGLTSLLKIWNELLTLIYSRTSQKIE